MKPFIFGLGYSALHFVRHHSRLCEHVAGTVRSIEKSTALAEENIEALLFSDQAIDAKIYSALQTCDSMIAGIAPGMAGDPVLGHFAQKLAEAPEIKRIIYLSTVGVYGDHDGAWIDEKTPAKPGSERSRRRLDAERAWADFAAAHNRDLHILRLAGIYGPGRNAIENLRNGKARRIVKRNQVFNRIHVEDIACAINACLMRPLSGEIRIWNIADNEPAPAQDVVAYAAQLLGIEPPPEISFENAEMTPMARSFYGENKRVANRAMRTELGVTLVCPTYREGLQSLLQGSIHAPK